MSSVRDHYERHLSPVYSWMAGGLETAVARGQQELTEIGLSDIGGALAVDLGAGFGMHSIPLARAGYEVLAIDSSAVLLAEMRAQGNAGSIMTVQDDLLNFPHYLSHNPDIVLCMGDTLTHLTERSSVTALIETVAQNLTDSGRFVVSLRDYSKASKGSSRFIPVRSDQSRILTCFLEYGEDTVEVHDILHELNEGSWSLRVSRYRKLRLEPGWLKNELQRCGFLVTADIGPSGMVRFCASKA